MTGGGFWGPHFPSPGALSYWGGHFPEDLAAPGTIPGRSLFGPTGPLIALSLETGAVVTYSWQTDLFKSYSGLECRAGLLDDPRQTYKGSAHLLADATLVQRSRLARSAAAGSGFLLALPFEELSIAGPASGGTVPVHAAALALCDWAHPGQRCVVMDVVDGVTVAVEGVVQSSTSTTIVMSPAPGANARIGARIMPLMAVYLDPQQGFARYPTAIETWSINARAAEFGFAGTLPVAAFVQLGEPLTHSGMLEGVQLFARGAGVDGNDISVKVTDDALTSAGEFVEDEIAMTIHIKYSGGDTTIAELVALLSTSALIGIRGTYDPTDILPTGDDEFDWEFLAGGVNSAPATMGTGATVTEYADRPVWNRGIDLNGTAPDSLQSMSEIVDLGGVPFAAGEASVPDWGRSVMLESSSIAEWQWCKAFLDAIEGRHRAFWLPTWRADLAATGTAASGAAVPATLPLSWVTDACAGLTVSALVGGTAMNGYTVQFIAAAALFIVETASAVTVTYIAGVSTPVDIQGLFVGLTYTELLGTPDTPANQLDFDLDEFGPQALTGGIDSVPGRLIIDATVGDFFAWYPDHDQLQVRATTGAVEYVGITGAVDNGATITLDLDAAVTAPVIEMVSWLELCRLESDDVDVTFVGAGFAMSTIARVVQYADEVLAETFLSKESGSESSNPREGIKIELPAVTYRIATGSRDIVIDGHTYYASPSRRDEIAIATAGNGKEVTITLPVSHPLAQRYLVNGVPPQRIIVTIYRQQGAIVETVWHGYITSMAPDRHLATFRVPSQLTEALERRLPTVTAGRECPHVLYDVNCRVDRGAHAIEAVVTAVDGIVVTVDALGGQPDQWAQFGELEHLPTGERMTIQDQTGLVLSIQLRMYGIAVGDHVVVSPGCSHGVVVCDEKFSNVENYGGFPYLNTTRNFFSPTGLGIKAT